MWENLTKTSLSYLNFGVRAAVVYLFVLVLLRLGGKRQMGQMSPAEFVTILLISNAVQNSMNGGDNSLSAGLFLATVLVAMTWVVSFVTYRSKRMSLLLEGRPRLLIHKGQILAKALDKERIRVSELKVLLRRQGIHACHDVAEAVLEGDGTLSVTKVSELPTGGSGATA